MPQAPLLQDLATVMIIASVMVFVMHRLRQPAVIGYLLAGLAIGPHTPPFALVRDIGTIRSISELGLAFLMFAIGLEFSLPRFRKAGPSAGVSAAIVVAGMLGCGYVLGRSFGWGQADSMFLGAILSISGSSVIAKVFMDLGLTQQRFAGAVFGLMISDDVAAMVMLSLVSGLGAASAAGVPDALAPLFKIGFFVLLFLLGGLVLVPRILQAVSRYQNPEMAGILTVGLCLGSAFLASHLGFSVALGAFLIGAIIASTSQAAQLGEWMQPIKSMFSALFFVSAGMLVDPSLLWAHLGPVAAIAAATIVLRTALGFFASLSTGHRLDDSVKIGVSISQIGEFSFVIAGLGVSLGLASDFLYPTAVIVSSASMFFTPLLIARADAIAGRLSAALPGLEPLLERYRLGMLGLGREKTQSPGGAIFGRYLVRLIAYVAVLIGLALALYRGDAYLRAAGLGWLWASRGVLALTALPVALLIAKYVSHLFLLLVTLVLARPAMSWLFQRMDIRWIYNVFHGAALAGLGAAVVAIVGPEASARTIALLAVALALIAELAVRRISPVLEWVEERLDEAFGRATSEPTRYAILVTGDRRSLFYDLTEQLLLPEGAAAVGRSIASLHVRNNTGATITAIYRDGEHLTNPAPGMVLQANDLIVLLGETPQRERARGLLLDGLERPAPLPD